MNAPLGHGNAVPCTQHNQAETIPRSLVKNSIVYLNQPLILLTLLLFGPNPISSMHYKDSETTHFCSPGGGWPGAAHCQCLGCCWSRRSGMRSMGSGSLQRKSLKGNFTRDKKRKATFNFLTTAFLPELFILAVAHSINEIFHQMTSSPARRILSGIPYFYFKFYCLNKLWGRFHIPAFLGDWCTTWHMNFADSEPQCG